MLNNKNIVLTRSIEQSTETIKKLKILGANVISFPTIRISSVRNNSFHNETLKNLDNFNSIIFISENAVNYFLLKLKELKIKFTPKNFFVICIGNKTAATCRLNDIHIDFQPSKFTAEVLVDELSNIKLTGKKFIIPSSSLSKSDQFKGLENLGAKITMAPVYENSINSIENLKEEISLLQNINIDLYIFTSPSTFNGFLKIMNIKNPKEYFWGKKTAVIGPVTEKALLEVGIKPNIIPQNYTMDYLIEEIKNFYN